MTETDQYRNGVIGVTNLARSINVQIGSYQKHHFSETMGFSVSLSNGAINMSIDIAHDFETQPSSITPDQIKMVANTFRKI
jgi:hypothetical protein